MTTSFRVPAPGWMACSAVCLAVGLGGCVKPGMRIDVSPAGIDLFVDGRLAPAARKPLLGSETRDTRDTSPQVEELRKSLVPDSRDLPLKYYGTTRLSGREPAAEELGWLGQGQEVSLDEPFSPWLFPFDFVLECVTYPFASDERYSRRVAIELQARPEDVGGVRPRSLPAISERARRAREGR